MWYSFGMNFFDVCLSNPPYQLALESDKERVTYGRVYDVFHERSACLASNVCMVYPSTWQMSLKSDFTEFLFGVGLKESVFVNGSHAFGNSVAPGYPVSVVNTVLGYDGVVVANGLSMCRDSGLWVDSESKRLLLDGLVGVDCYEHGVVTPVGLSNVVDAGLVVSDDSSVFSDAVCLRIKENAGVSGVARDVWVERECLDGLSVGDVDKFDVVIKSSAFKQNRLFISKLYDGGDFEAELFKPGCSFGATFTWVESFDSEREAECFVRYLNSRVVTILCTLRMNKNEFLSNVPLFSSVYDVVDWDASNIDMELLRVWGFSDVDSRVILNDYYGVTHYFSCDYSNYKNKDDGVFSGVPSRDECFVDGWGFVSDAGNNKSRAEVFTPRFVVDGMLSMTSVVPDEGLFHGVYDASDADRVMGLRIVEPAIGTGNYSATILYYKLQYAMLVSSSEKEFQDNIVKCLCSMHGFDIDPGNIEVFKQRLLKTSDFTSEKSQDSIIEYWVENNTINLTRDLIKDSMGNALIAWSSCLDTHSGIINTLYHEKAGKQIPKDFKRAIEKIIDANFTLYDFLDEESFKTKNIIINSQVDDNMNLVNVVAKNIHEVYKQGELNILHAKKTYLEQKYRVEKPGLTLFSEYDFEWVNKNALEKHSLLQQQITNHPWNKK